MIADIIIALKDDDKLGDALTRTELTLGDLNSMIKRKGNLGEKKAIKEINVNFRKVNKLTNNIKSLIKTCGKLAMRMK